MANTTPIPGSEFISRPLYVYDLPVELLSTLSYRSNTAGATDWAPELLPSVQESKPESKPESSTGISTSTSCSVCNIKFATVADQRDHVRSDLHRYNLKMKLKGLSIMDESTFSKAIGDLDESISGSDSSSSDEDDETDSKPGDSTLNALLRRQAKISEARESDLSPSKVKSSGNLPLYWMTSPKLPEDTVLGVYRAILSNTEQEEVDQHLIDALKSKQLKPTLAKTSGNTAQSQKTAPPNTPHFFMCMVGGGHFAAMIVALAPEIMKKGGGAEERHARVLAHKTFHRYTTRRKQGGSQGANDNAKGNAHSAGSSLRRYNEAALENDIRSLLTEWKSMIDSSELLFVRATGTMSRRTLFGTYEGQVLRSNDPRLRGFPFTTRRATQSELMRSFAELTRLKVGKLSDIMPKETPSTTAKQSPVTKPTVTAPSLSPEEEALQLHTSQVTALIKRSKAPALLSYLTNNSLSPSFQFFPINHHTPTPLHLASSLSSHSLVLSLLTKPKPQGADPTVLNSSGSPPFDLAGNLQTRLAFRVARGLLGESAWNWTTAHVPSGLTQSEADAILKRTEQTERDEEAQRRKDDLDRISKEEQARKVEKTEKKAGKGRELGGSAPQKTAQDIREEEMRGMTPEMRTRLERERRARAAEERFKKMKQGG